MTFKKGQIEETIKVDKVIEKEFNSLPHNQHKDWTPEADKMIRRYWRVKDQMSFTKMFGKKFFKVGLRTLATRARTLGV